MFNPLIPALYSAISKAARTQGLPLFYAAREDPSVPITTGAPGDRVNTYIGPTRHTVELRHFRTIDISVTEQDSPENVQQFLDRAVGVLYVIISGTVLEDPQEPGCRILVSRSPKPSKSLPTDTGIVRDPALGVVIAVDVYAQYRRALVVLSAIWGVQIVAWPDLDRRGQTPQDPFTGSYGRVTG
jgi:hypothetical protein